MGNSQSTDAPAGGSSSPTAPSAPPKRPRERDASQHRRRISGQQPLQQQQQAGQGQGQSQGYGYGSSSTQAAALRKPVQPALSQGQRQEKQAPSVLPPSQPHQPHQLLHHNPLAPSSAVASTSNATAYATVSASPAPTSPARSRAKSVATAIVPPRTHLEEAAHIMGQADSRPRPPSRSTTLPPPPSHHADADMKPDVFPAQTAQLHDLGMEDVVFPYGLPASDFSRPPRLPLAIETTSHEPGSPIPLPADADAGPLDASELGAMLGGRRTSMLSSTTLDDEDAAEMDPSMLDTGPSQIKVPTKIHYQGVGDEKAVYVTGTFAMWERKFRLHRNPQTGSFSATFPLPTGTHHLKFLVDGDMRTSEELPTTVDFTNALVNYIEVMAPTPHIDGEQNPASDPMPIPGAAAAAGQSPGTVDGAARPVDIPRDSTASHQGTTKTARGGKATVTGAAAVTEQEPKELPKKRMPRPKYTTTIPPFLLDLDLYATPEDARFQRATRVSNALPAPPSLPGFMVKSILNVNTPHKDDASVLAMPNHTVLYHLATSSIKNGVLATSGTTRYKRKFLTTIMYKPTSDDG